MTWWQFVDVWAADVGIFRVNGDWILWDGPGQLDVDNLNQMVR